MSSAAPQPNSDRTAADQQIETVYTTVESQHDRTDWLTVVSNLRQINRQLVEEIGRLEQALASAKQTLHIHKEQNQTHEITILQQQDDLRIAQERVGALFQQLETSHQIGQRQQILIETLSQQLEIAQAIVPQLEAENEELTQKDRQQAQQLAKTERVAVELHRRLKILQSKATTNSTAATPTTSDLGLPQNPSTASLATPIHDPAISVGDAVRSEMLDRQEFANHDDLNPTHPAPDLSPLQTAIAEADLFPLELEPAPPLTPRQVSEEIPPWTPSAPTSPAKTILSPPKSASATSWREAIASNNANYYATPDSTAEIDPLTLDTADKESNAIDEDLKMISTPNWPAPTIDRSPATKPVKIDLPKFPKRSEN